MSKVAEHSKKVNPVELLRQAPEQVSVELSVQEFSDRMEFEKKRLAMMREFVKSQMKEGVHFGKIPGTKGKPTLLKPGAELLTNIHNLHPEFEETERVFDRSAVKHYKFKRWQDGRQIEVEGDCRGYVKYSYRCSLIKNGVKVGEGVGTCNNWEKKYLSVDVDDAENTIMKMSKKRSFIDSTLTATRTSDFFSQDLEDKNENGHGEDAPRSQSESGNAISEPRQKRLWAIAGERARELNLNKSEKTDMINEVLKAHRQAKVETISGSVYDAVVKSIQSWEPRVSG